MSKSKKSVSSETALEQTVDYFFDMIMLIFMFAMLVIYPLAYHNKYFDMGDAKYTIFRTISFVSLALLLATTILWICSRYKKENFLSIAKRCSITDWLALGYLAASYCSFVLSSDINMAFWGFSGWNMGFVSQAIFVLTYFYVSRQLRYSNTLLILALCTAAITYGLAVLQRFAIDPLHMYDNLGPEYIEKFVSTLGQTTWYSSYAVLIIPIGMFYYFTMKRSLFMILPGIFLFLGSASLCTVNSDSAYIAYVLIFMVYFWFALESNERFKRFLEMAIITFAAFKTVGILQDIFPERMIVLISGEEKISHFVTHSNIMLALLVIFVGLYFVRFDVTKLKFLRNVMIVGAIAVIWGVVLLIILVTNEKLPAMLNSLYSVEFFRFDNLWGNNRGFNWRVAAGAFWKASFKDKLIGVGPDCFALSMDKYYAAEVEEYWHGLKLACAHNEFLNLLNTGGILGVFTYYGMFFTSLARMGKKAVKEPALIFCMAIIVAYIGHNLFCYQTCVCTPYVFIFTGMGEMMMRKLKDTGNVSGTSL